MRTLVVLVIAGLLAPSWARATTGTCTITSMAQINPYPLGFTFPMPIATGFAIPVEFDEAAGRFTIHHDAWRAQFPDLGAEFNTIGGVHGYLQFDPGETVGTIDASGLIALPGFGVTNSTDFESPPPVLPVVGHDVSTGPVVKTISTVSRAVVGVPVDFATGKVVLVGLGLIVGAPGGGGTNMAGFRMACTLSPIPDASLLPPGAALAKVKGKAKRDKKPFEHGSKADQLTLKATVTPGPTPLVLDGTQSLVLGISVGGAETVTVYVAAGDFRKKGKKIVVTRDDTCKIKKNATTGVCRNDGSTCESFSECAGDPALQVLAGRKEEGDAQSQLGGTITLKPGKGGTSVLSAKIQGLDLSTVSGNVDLTVAIGPVSAGAQAAVSN